MRRITLGLAILLAAAPASAQTLDTLLHFNGTNGANPIGGVVVDSGGNFFGATERGGVSNHGTVFRLESTGGGAYAHTTLHNFSPLLGAWPNAGVTLDAAGNILGTAGVGGTGNAGNVFRLTATGPGSYAHSIVFSFDWANGSYPSSNLIIDPAGAVFGTTGTDGPGGWGTVFNLTPGGGGTYTHSTIASFDFLNGKWPTGTLARDPAGNLFGVANEGGANDRGTVFRLVPNGVGGYALSTLHTFNMTDGAFPAGSLLLAPSGDLFGTTQGGGANFAGTVFRLASDGLGGYALTTLYEFTSAIGLMPLGGLIADAAGNLFGTTLSGGAHNFGTIFRLEPDGGGAYTHTTLYDFDGGTGRNPQGDLIADETGNLYGITRWGGTSDQGTVFRLSNAGFVVASNESPTATPEPASLAILSLAVLSLAAARRRHPAAAA